MQNLINIEQKQIGTQFVQSVYARDLHAFLEVRRDFTTWIKQRIAKFGFVENQDFVVFDSPVPVNQVCHGGDRRSKEYFVALDMAKELSMVERTPKGKEARLYFIECERRLRSGEEPSKSLDNNIASIKQFMVVLKANKALGVSHQVAVEQSRQTMRDNGVNIDKILPMPAIESQACTANDDAARDRIFSIIQSKGSVPQGILFNRCRNLRKEDVQKHLDALLAQRKVQQITLENPTNKKRFNCYQISVTLN
jgi:phage anti-repressor protein